MYTAAKIAKKYNLTPAAVYLAAKLGHIEAIENTKPIQYTKESVESHWASKADNDQEKINEDHENRIRKIEVKLWSMENDGK